MTCGLVCGLVLLIQAAYQGILLNPENRFYLIHGIRADRCAAAPAAPVSARCSERGKWGGIATAGVLGNPDGPEWRLSF
jgi:hypothetical protein